MTEINGLRSGINLRRGEGFLEPPEGGGWWWWVPLN
jgi:hypothetical protein